MNSNAAAKRVRDARTQAGTRQHRRPKAVNDSILDALANEASTLRDRAVIRLLIDTGLRGGEIVRLNRTMITFDPDGNGGGGELPVNKSPTRRTFRFGPRAARALQAYLRSERTEDQTEALFLNYQGNRVSVPQLSKMIHHLCAKLGIDRISLYQFRVNYAVRFMNGGGSIHVLAKLLGFKDYSGIRFLGTLTDSVISRVYTRAMEAANPYSAVC
jgi:site-specific recombinase XerD